MKRLTLLLVMVTINLAAQTLEMQRFPLLDPISNSIPESFIIEGNTNEVIIFWIDSTDLNMSKSLDDGATWDTPITLVDKTLLLDSLSDLNALKLNSGRILVTYKSRLHYLIYSDDNGLTWSEETELQTEANKVKERGVKNSSLTQTDDGKIWFVYNRLNLIYSIQSDDGVSWSERDTIIQTSSIYLNSSTPSYGTINTHWNGSLVLICQIEKEDTSRIYELKSIDSGKTWSEPRVILDDGINKRRPIVYKDSHKNLWLTFVETEPTPFEDYYQNNIYYSKLPDGAYSWGIPTKFTQYVDFDGWQNLSIANDKPYISFTSNRVSGGYTLWYGIADESNDNSAVPVIFNAKFHFQNDYPKANVNINAEVYSQNTLNSVMFYYTISNVLDSIQLFDDGFHNDKEAGDFIFGNDIVGLYYKFSFDYFISVTDIFGGKVFTSSEKVSSPFEVDGGDAFLFDNNNLWLPINSKGVIADVHGENLRGGGKFDDITVIYSSGFALSGYTNGNLWANGVMTSTRVGDYLHGTIANVGSINKIHVVRSSQPDFYQSWDDWKDAVKQGADFYDGDGDGVYDPVDKNNNGKWDEDEDKPNIIGDITAFTVFYDGVDPSLRLFENVEPQGIEIKQTVFSYNKATSPKLANVIFVRYKIENMGTVADRLDSVYFGTWADLDIGDALDDLIGTDSTLNSSYAYNAGFDDQYGINPPACFVSFIQAPPVYIEGETFIDENGSGNYEDGIDTPLDSALNRKGILGDVEKLPGAKNNKLTANIHSISSYPTQGNPDNEYGLRNYMLGYNQQGDLIDPCNWTFGEVMNGDCSMVTNPRLMYSGDPVTGNGWINVAPYDQKQLGSTGPFDLVKGKPIEIIVAYIVGRGTDNLSSITEARRITNDVIGFYNTNFSYVPVGVKESSVSQLPTEFSLSQNYPNPFNPSTTIQYSIPNVGSRHASTVQLKIYDILGREVATLVNQQQKPGNYEVTFNASSVSRRISSGVYFYRLQVYPAAGGDGSFVESKKMILLK